MNIIKQSILGEARILTKFVEDGYDVFTQFSGKEPFDLAVHKDGVLQRVSIKSTSFKQNKDSRTYYVQLKRVRSNKTENKIYKFDTDECDILAVYVEPEDFVILLDPKKLGTSGVSINMDKIDTKGWKTFF